MIGTRPHRHDRYARRAFSDRNTRHNRVPSDPCARAMPLETPCPARTSIAGPRINRSEVPRIEREVPLRPCGVPSVELEVPRRPCEVPPIEREVLLIGREVPLIEREVPWSEKRVPRDGRGVPLVKWSHNNSGSQSPRVQPYVPDRQSLAIGQSTDYLGESRFPVWYTGEGLCKDQDSSQAGGSKECSPVAQ